MDIRVGDVDFNRQKLGAKGPNFAPGDLHLGALLVQRTRWENCKSLCSETCDRIWKQYSYIVLGRLAEADLHFVPCMGHRLGEPIAAGNFIFSTIQRKVALVHSKKAKESSSLPVQNAQEPAPPQTPVFLPPPSVLRLINVSGECEAAVEASSLGMASGNRSTTRKRSYRMIHSVGNGSRKGISWGRVPVALCALSRLSFLASAVMKRDKRVLLAWLK